MDSENFDDIRMDYNRLNILSLNNDPNAMNILSILAAAGEFISVKNFEIDTISLLNKSASTGNKLSIRLLSAMGTLSEANLESLLRSDFLEKEDDLCAKYCFGRINNKGIDFFYSLEKGFLPAAVRIERMSTGDDATKYGSDFEFDGLSTDVKEAYALYRDGKEYLSDSISCPTNEDIYMRWKAEDCLLRAVQLGHIPALEDCYWGYCLYNFSLQGFYRIDLMLEYISKTNKGHFSMYENMDNVRSQAQKFLPNPYIENLLSQIQR